MKVNIKKPRYVPDSYSLVYRFLSVFPMGTDRIKVISKQVGDSLLGVLVTRFNKLFEPEDYIEIEPHDTWSCDSTLALIITPLLKQFRKNNNGYPAILDVNDVPNHLKSTLSKGDYEDESSLEAWEWIVDEMIWAFQQKNRDWESDFYTYGDSNDIDPYGPCSSLKYDHEGREQTYARMKNGFRLFGKYFEAIWE